MLVNSFKIVLTYYLGQILFLRQNEVIFRNLSHWACRETKVDQTKELMEEMKPNPNLRIAEEKNRNK